MQTAAERAAAPVTRPVRFFPAVDGRGKWHAANRVTGTAVCGSAAELATSGADWIAPVVGMLQGKVHPLVCRSCLRQTTSPGLAAIGTV